MLGGVPPPELVKAEVDTHLEEPGTEPPGCVESVESCIDLPERFLGDVASQLLVVEHSGKDALELALVASRPGRRRRRRRLPGFARPGARHPLRGAGRVHVPASPETRPAEEINSGLFGRPRTAPDGNQDHFCIACFSRNTYDTENRPRRVGGFSGLPQSPDSRWGQSGVASFACNIRRRPGHGRWFSATSSDARLCVCKTVA